MDFPFFFLLADCGTILRCIKAFSECINQLLFPFSNAKTFVASSTNQIKIYDFKSFVKKNEFTPKDDARIVVIRMIPHDDRMLVVCSNNIVCILTSALKLIRHFEPLKARQKYLQKANQKMEKLNYVSQPDDDNDDNMNVDKLIKALTRDSYNGIVMDASFAPNGSSFCLCFADNSMMFCSATLWDVRRVIKFPDFYIKQSDFITYNGENNANMLLTATSNDDLMLISLKDLNSKMLIDMNNSTAFSVSSNGKILLNIQQSGEILVYNMDNCLNEFVDMDTTNCTRTLTETDEKCTKKSNNDWSIELDRIQMKVISMVIVRTFSMFMVKKD